MKIILYNNYNYHYEVIETLINRYNIILNIDKKNNSIFIYTKRNDSFIKYIYKKYPKIKFISNLFDADYIIDCTIYKKDKNRIIPNSDKYFYISHDVITDYNELSNVYYITPIGQKYLRADILPFCYDKKIKTKMPIYVIQGNFTKKRRDYSFLKIILNHKFKYDFRIKLLGRGKPPIKHPKIIVKKNLDFINYHKEFLNVYCILPLISKETHPQYYNEKLTSTMSYTYAYKLHILLDQELQDIYNHKKAFTYNNKEDFLKMFKVSLIHFYQMKNKIY